MTRTLLEMRAVTVEYPSGQPALIEADIEILEGDYIGIVGPSGSGKTTLLKTIAGAIAHTSGKVIRARNVRFGYVPQVDQINWQFPVTVLEVLLMAGTKRILPWPSKQEVNRANTLLGKLGLSELGHRHIRALSGGQQQRVFIARALMLEPDVLLLDEPTSGVDVATRHDVLHLLHDLNHSDGIAVVITTHDLNGIASHMHTLICLNQRVIASGIPSEILTEDVLEMTYGAPLSVLSHGGMPFVVDHYEDDLEESAIHRAHHQHP